MSLAKTYVCDGCGAREESSERLKPKGWRIRRWHPGVIVPPYPVPEMTDLHACSKEGCAEKVDELSTKYMDALAEAHRRGQAPQ